MWMVSSAERIFFWGSPNGLSSGVHGLYGHMAKVMLSRPTLGRLRSLHSTLAFSIAVQSVQCFSMS